MSKVKIKIKLYIQAIKHAWAEDFKIEVSCYQRRSDERDVVIDIDDTEVEVSCPDFEQADFTNGHVEQLRKVKEELLAETHQKAKVLDEQIENLLAIENKS